MLAALSGMFAVILGAFGAHLFKKILTPDEFHTFDIGIHYHYYHTFALAIVAILGRYVSHRWTSMAAWLFLFGTILFSGSLYMLSIVNHMGMAELTKVFGPITPIGGLLLIGGWLAMFRAAFEYKKPSHHRSSSSSDK
jgi:uncharacterized membrane protein YgdD (TMEM256/DUF423 family)